MTLTVQPSSSAFSDHATELLEDSRECRRLNMKLQYD